MANKVKIWNYDFVNWWWKRSLNIFAGQDIEIFRTPACALLRSMTVGGFLQRDDCIMILLITPYPLHRENMIKVDNLHIASAILTYMFGKHVNVFCEVVDELEPLEEGNTYETSEEESNELNRQVAYWREQAKKWGKRIIELQDIIAKRD